ncbi:MAG: hypothetical protein Q8P59_06720, partial [Dehalococcoidia bacterium]|nr:hypothetical protein [Dehalococcoidia bacterium]
TSLVPSYASASSVSYQAPDTSSNRQGLYPAYAGDGHTTADNSLGRSAVQVPSNNYAYFNVDDSYVYQDISYTFASIQVSYYDGGTGQFVVEYDASSGAPGYSSYPVGYTNSTAAGQTIFLTGSNNWVTATLYFSNVNFGNRQISGLADFRLNYQPASGEAYRLTFDRVIVTRSTTDLTPSYASAETVSFSSPSVESGLFRATASGSDGRITTNEDYGRVGSQVSSAGYASFNIDDTYLYQGKQGTTNYPYATVEVSYYDKGRGFFLIEYDGVGDSGAYTAIPTKERIYLTDSSTWITATFYLTNTYFANRQGFSSDLRINYQPGGDSYRLVFDRISVRRSTTNLEPDYNAVSSVYFQSPLTQYGLRIRNLSDSQTTLVVFTDTQGITRTTTQVSASGY